MFFQLLHMKESEVQVSKISDVSVRSNKRTARQQKTFCKTCSQISFPRLLEVFSLMLKFVKYQELINFFLAVCVCCSEESQQKMFMFKGFEPILVCREGVHPIINHPKNKSLGDYRNPGWPRGPLVAPQSESPQSESDSGWMA